MRELTRHVKDNCLNSLFCILLFLVFFQPPHDPEIIIPLENLQNYHIQKKKKDNKKKTACTYLSLMKLALMKQKKPESMRVISRPGILLATGYCLVLQKISVPCILPSFSTSGRIEFSIILAKDIITCDMILCHARNQSDFCVLFVDLFPTTDFSIITN